MTDDARARLSRALALGGPFDSEMMREDGTPKGAGYFGFLPNIWGGHSTELSANSDIGGTDTLYPLMVPTLSAQQLARLLMGKHPTADIYDAAEAHAAARLMQGRSPFAGIGEQRDAPQLPMAFAPVTPKFPGLLE